MNKIQKAHCLFEQSGAFKNAFKKLGIPAEDYDIQNNFNQTDHIIDLFAEIEKAYKDDASIFDSITPEDLIIAFFPCIYFETMQIGYYDGRTNNLPLDVKEKFSCIINRIQQREKFYILLYQLVAICEIRGLRLIIENPATQPHYLHYPRNFYFMTKIVDNNRRLRGDYFKKPTAYWFLNIKPTYGESYKVNKSSNTIVKTKGSKIGGGCCSEDRSLISPLYAYNFLCDFVLGKENEYTQKTLF